MAHLPTSKLDRFGGPECLCGRYKYYVNLLYNMLILVFKGWGKTSVGGKPSEVLLDAFIPIWKRGECEHLFQSRNDPIDYQLQFCAGPKDGGEDACDVINSNQTNLI